jgi:hypothetical protein
MTVDRTQLGRKTTYALRDGGKLACVLTYGAVESDPEPEGWKILLPGPGDTEDLYGAEQFSTPGPSVIRGWLAPIVGDDRAAELTAAVDADPPRTSGWRRQDEGAE